MEIDKNIKKKFEEREMRPSASAWERLSNQLDSHARKKRRRRFFYISSAASILLLLSLFLMKNKENSIEAPLLPERSLVESSEPIKEVTKDKELVLQEETIVVKNDIPVKEVPVKRLNKKSNSPKKKEFVPIDIKKLDNVSNEAIAQKEKPKQEIINTKTSDVASLEKKKINTKRVSVNSDALLYSVTHTEAEVIAYYRAHKIDRNDVLNSIKKELQKSNLKIDARTILADVERDIDDASFKENFMKIIKKRVSDLATAIASRND